VTLRDSDHEKGVWIHTPFSLIFCNKFPIFAYHVQITLNKWKKRFFISVLVKMPGDS
jgi:hypothetical protein